MRKRAHRFLLPFVASLFCLTLAFACGTQEVSIPYSFPPRDSSTGEDGATDSAVADQGTADTGPDAPDVVCPEVQPDDGRGVFVSPGGTNDVSCGTRAAPCKAVNVGITHAVAASKPNVYVARGTYVEKVTLAGGITVVGGWDFDAGSSKWRRTCVDPAEIVVFRAPAGQSVTVEARDLPVDPATLSLVRVESKAAAVAASESLYGLLAVGATTSVVLENVHIELGAAGAGTTPAQGAAGAGGELSCAAGVGGPGIPGTAGTGAGIGTFDSTGYVPATATAGDLGTAGNNGLAGGVGECIQCGTCDTFLNGCALLPDPATTCGKDGQPGCGGGPGTAGLPGTGGGSSIGIYAWDATVAVRGGKIKSGDAGAGGVGAAGGNGGVPTAAAVGTASDACTYKCEVGVLACVEAKMKAAGGAAGTAGGAGGNGGNGGGGGGGSSFAFYAGGIGVISTESNPTLGHGKAGAGGGVGAAAGVPGAAADHVP